MDNIKMIRGRFVVLDTDAQQITDTRAHVVLSAWDVSSRFVRLMRVIVPSVLDTALTAIASNQRDVVINYIEPTPGKPIIFCLQPVNATEVV